MRLLGILLAGSLLVGLAGFILWTQSAPRIPEAWSRIVPGMKEDEVEAILGDETRFHGCNGCEFEDVRKGSPLLHGQDLYLVVRMIRHTRAGMHVRSIEPDQWVCQKIHIEQHQRIYAIRRGYVLLRSWW